MDTSPNAAYIEHYRDRLRRVLEYIDAHLDGELSVARLSRVAAFSKFHFHRQFAARFGLGVHEYVLLQRFKRASFRLAFRAQHTVLQVALASGYDGPEAFARAFKKRFGQTPSEFRRRPAWAVWWATYQPLSQLRSATMTSSRSPAQVQIVNFAETRVAALEHRGDPARLGDSIRAFIAFRREHGLPPARSATFNVLHDDPTQTSPEAFRMDLCAATDRAVPDNPYGVVARAIPAGRCAVIRHTGSDDTLGETIRYLYAEWLPASGEAPRDFPLYCQRVRFYPDVPEPEAVTDVFLPLK